MAEPPASSARQFATTHWSVVVAAGRQHTATAQAALAQLCETYWYPLYAYVRRRGYQRDDAQDLTQAFFTRLLDKEIVRHADRERGRFRSFLLSSLNHFLANEWRKQSAEKRGGGRRALSLDFDSAEQRFKREPVDDMTPQRIFDRRWALTVLQAALERVQEQYARRNRLVLFEALAPVLEGERQPYKDIATKLGMTEGAVKVAVQRLRKSYRQGLRELIAQTVADPGQIDEELDALLEAVRG